MDNSFTPGEEKTFVLKKLENLSGDLNNIQKTLEDEKKSTLLFEDSNDSISLPEKKEYDQLLYTDRHLDSLINNKDDYQSHLCHAFNIDIKLMEKLNETRKEVKGKQGPFEFTNIMKKEHLIWLDTKEQLFISDDNLICVTFEKLNDATNFLPEKLNEYDKLLRKLLNFGETILRLRNDPQNFDFEETFLRYWSDLQKCVTSFLKKLLNLYSEWFHVLSKYSTKKYLFCQYEGDKICCYNIKLQFDSRQNFDNFDNIPRYSPPIRIDNLNEILFGLPANNIEICSYCSYFRLNIPKNPGFVVPIKYFENLCNALKFYGGLPNFIDILKPVWKNVDKEFSHNRLLSLIDEEQREQEKNLKEIKILRTILNIAEECNKKPNSSNNYSNDADKLKSIFHQIWNSLPLSKEMRNKLKIANGGSSDFIF